VRSLCRFVSPPPCESFLVVDLCVIGGGFGEGAGGVAVAALPGSFVDVGFQGGFEGLAGVVGTAEAGVAGEEAFFVAVGVDESGGDVVGAATWAGYSSSAAGSAPAHDRRAGA
jgi:hypothetical protein